MQGITKKEKGPGHLNLKASRRSRPDAASDDPETGGESPAIIARSAARARRNGEPCAVFFLRQPASFSSPPPWPGDPLKGSRSIVPRCVAPASQPATTERPPRPGSRPAPTAAQFNFAGILSSNAARAISGFATTTSAPAMGAAMLWRQSHPPPPSRIKRLAPAAAAGSSRSVSASEPATQALSIANRQIGLDLCLERATSTA